MKNFGKIKNLFMLALLVAAGFCFFGTNKVVAAAPSISDVSISNADDSSFTVNWRTSVASWTRINVGTSGGSMISVFGTDAYLDTEAPFEHSYKITTVNGVDVSDGTTYYFRITGHNGEGDTLSEIYSIIPGAPYLTQIDSTTPGDNCDGDGQSDKCVCTGSGAERVCTYGPGSEINITATYSEPIGDTGVMAVKLNTGGTPTTSGISLGTKNGSALAGTYTVGVTETSGQNTLDLTVSSITNSQNVCDSSSPTPLCVTNKILPPPGQNLGDLENIKIDTTAPVFSGVSPATSAYINSVTAANGGSDISYTLSEAIANVSNSKILITRTGGNADAGTHTCTLIGEALNTGVHSAFNTATGCSEGAITLVDGTIYSFAFSATDLYGNQSSVSTSNFVNYAITPPALNSFSSSTSNGVYDTGDRINVTATFSEDLAANSTMDVTLDTGGTASLTRNSSNYAQLIGNYAVGVGAGGQNSNDLKVQTIYSSSVHDLAGNGADISLSNVYGHNIDDNNAIIVDTQNYSIQYYDSYDSDTKTFSNLLLSPPRLKEGKYYLKITSSQAIPNNEEPKVSITSEGNANNATDASTIHVSGNYYVYERSIGSTPVVGFAQENISITGKNPLGNSKKANNLLAESSQAAYTDTVKPRITSAEIAPHIASTNDNVTVTLSFGESNNNGLYEKMNQNVSVDASLVNSAENITPGQKGFNSNSYNTWVGYYSFNELSTNNEWNLVVSGATDAAGNVMEQDSNDSNDNKRKLIIDTQSPTITVGSDPGDGVSQVPVHSDYIKVNVVNTQKDGYASTPIKQYYGFSSDDDPSSCRTLTYTRSLLSNGSLTISDDNNSPQYLCIMAEDGVGNKAYFDFGGNNKLHVDNTAPTIVEIVPGTDQNESRSNHGGQVAGNYVAGEKITVNVIFSEKINGSAKVYFNTDPSEASCDLNSTDPGAFTVDNSENFSVPCTFTVEIGENTDGFLAVRKITGSDPAIGDLVASNPNELAHSGSGNNITYSISGVPNLVGSDIKIDMTPPEMKTVSATYNENSADGKTYGPGKELVLKATYNKPIATNSEVIVVLNNGVEVPLIYNDSLNLTGTYRVGATGSGETKTNLGVVSLKGQNVTDATNVSLTSVSEETYSGTNPSGINIDTTAPVVSEFSPGNEGNINSTITTFDPAATSGISYKLTTDSLIGLNADKTNADIAARIVFTGVAAGTRGQTEDKTGDTFNIYTCYLPDDFLRDGTYNNFDTQKCKDASGELLPKGIELKKDALYDISFYGQDAYGNEGSAIVASNVSFGIDANAPLISNCSIPIVPLQNSTVDNPSVEIVWYTDESSNSFVDYGTESGKYTKTVGSMDAVISAEDGGGNNGKFKHTVKISELSGGTRYYFRVRSSDPEGNESKGDNCPDYPASFITNGASTPPIITNIQVPTDKITSNSAKITWETNNVMADSYVEYGKTTDYGQIFGSYSMTMSHSVVLPSDLDSETTYHFRVVSKDAFNSESKSNDETFTTLKKTAGEANTGIAPTISGIKVSTGTVPNSMIVAWTTSGNANGIVRYGLDNLYGQTAADDLTIDNKDIFSTNHTVILRDLLSNASYNFKAVSYDIYGNIAVSANQTFSTATLQLASEPKVTSTNAKSAVIVWETIDPTFSSLQYGTSTSYGKTFQDAILANMHRVELTGLQSGQVYHFKIKGGKSTDLIYSADYLFGTFLKPVVSGFEASDIKDVTVVVKWKVSVPSESYVEYQNADDAEDKGTQGTLGLQTDNQVTLTGLRQGSKYAAKIKGIDVNKNAFESAEIKFETLLDVTPPEISQVSTDSSLVTGKEDKVQTIISWKTDEVATSQVFFDIGGGNEGELNQKSKEDQNLTTNHLVVLTNLRSGMVYHFKVLSKDKNANLRESQDFTLLTPQKKQSVIQMIIANFEQSFGFLKKMRN